MDKYVLIMGAGTVGIRDADVLMSMGIPVVLCKYDAREDDIKTSELRSLISRYRNCEAGSKLKLYAARGKDLDLRIKNFHRFFGMCSGSIDEINRSEIEFVIDATDGREGRNFLEVYEPENQFNLPFAINGGGDDFLVKKLYWASTPNSIVQKQEDRYKNENCKIVSCNTHFLVTAFGCIKEALATTGLSKPLEDIVEDMLIIFNRRHDDPHKGKKRPEYVSVAHKEYHVEELVYLADCIDKSQVHTIVSKWPTEYFHNVTVVIDFGRFPADSFAQDIRRVFMAYPRAILAGNEISHQKTMDATRKARILDGDIPFPVYSIKQFNKKIIINGLTPQRGIVAPSTADLVLLRTSFIPGIGTWQDAFNYTNLHAAYKKEPFWHIKNSIQDNLSC